MYYLGPILLEEQPITKKFIRADMSQIAIFRQEKPGVVKFTAISHSDIKGSMPHFLMNAGASKVAQEGIKQLRKQYADLDKQGIL